MKDSSRQMHTTTMLCIEQFENSLDLFDPVDEVLWCMSLQRVQHRSEIKKQRLSFLLIYISLNMLDWKRTINQKEYKSTDQHKKPECRQIDKSMQRENEKEMSQINQPSPSNQQPS